MKKVIRLSHDIYEGMPLYPDTPECRITPVREMAKGDSCNTSYFSFSSHSGTHVDFPRHFFAAGESLNSCKLQDLIFLSPVIIDCLVQAGDVIEPFMLSEVTQYANVDLLLIRTGFQTYRSSDPEVYCTRNPCLSPECARWLRLNLPRLRCVGIDCISISSRANRHLGREAHEVLLGEHAHSDHAVLILEDMDLARLGNQLLDEVIVVPLMVTGAEASPCTVLGYVHD